VGTSSKSEAASVPGGGKAGGGGSRSGGGGQATGGVTPLTEAGGTAFMRQQVSEGNLRDSWLQVCIRQHTSVAYVRIRQHTSAYVCKRFPRVI
jgi:hypothetical protein